MPSRLRILTALTATLFAAATAPALADDVVADDLTRDTPIAAQGGVLAYSKFDEAAQRYRLVLQTATSRVLAPIASSRKPFDVSLGTDRRGSVVLYTRCATSKNTGCDVYRYRLGAAGEQKIDSVSGPTEDEAWPAESGDLLTFVRRRAHGAPKGAEISDCDRIYVKRLSSKAPSKRLDRGSCARTTGLSIRGERIVQVTFGSPPGTRFDSQVRLLSARGGASKLLARQGSGEESNEFASPSQSYNSIWLTRAGTHIHGNFVRLDLASRKLTEVSAHAGLEGAFARDASNGAFYYLQTSESFEQNCTDSGSAPCRLMRTTVSPFSSAERALAPALTIGAPSDAGTAVFGDPFALSGRLTRTIVSRGSVVRREPVAGVTVRLLRRVTDASQPGLHEGFEPTPATTSTGADGSWSIALAAPPAQPWFSAVTEGQPTRTFAGRGTVGTVSARVTLTVTGGSFAGTVTPAQPGRTVKIQRLTKRTCQTATNGQRFCNDTWAAVADAPLNAAGTGFAASVASPAPGIYTAALPFADQQADPAAYGGRSPDVIVGG